MRRRVPAGAVDWNHSGASLRLRSFPKWSRPTISLKPFWIIWEHELNPIFNASVEAILRCCAEDLQNGETVFTSNTPVFVVLELRH